MNLSVKRPFSAADWYNAPHPDFKHAYLVGDGPSSKSKWWPGDIIATETYVGFISGPFESIFADTVCVVENGFGWRQGTDPNFRVIRVDVEKYPFLRQAKEPSP
jgi:hypothetical protein